MMVASVSGRQALGLSRPCTVSRISKPGSVSVAGASTLRILRSNAGLGGGLRTGISSSSTLQGLPLLELDQKGLFSLGRGNSGGGIRCEAASAASSAFGPDANAEDTKANNVPSASDVTLAQRVRAIFFYLTTLVIAVPLFVVMLALQPFVLLLDKQRRRAQHLVNKFWAGVTTSLFYRTEIEGWENLPAADEGAVYVANHQSFLDIYTLFQLGRPFKFISKTSNFLIPIIGWSMYLTGHIPLKRMDKRSQLECLKTCMKLVKEGVSVLFFPEGTRTTDGAMASFKKGAFSVAAKGGVPVVPITLIGSGKLMPNGLEYSLRPGVIKMIVHPPIRGKSADELCDESRKVIAETLIKHGLPVH